ncbi:MAG: VCBS repeat domain-containing M23 family metallopeptidase [Myxococcales bacterium]|nr:VCBS repeat domain-containing M23 family metallopeptidase [Myxococcales bacterium]
MTRVLASLALTCALAFALMLVLGSVADAQTRLRRPYNEAYRLNYGFDNNGAAAGCSDYDCGGACYNGHTGADFGTPLGTVLVAAQAGTVTATHNGCANYGGLGNTCGGRCGNYVQIRHADGSLTIYCHMQINSITVRTGQAVSCGQTIGRSASSGNSTGPHLHLGWRPGGGSSRDPFRGRCGASTSAWVEQRGYREPVGTSCSACTPQPETCNGRDDDCDGRVDENLTRSCMTACGSGSQSCSAGSWGSCSAPTPQPEVCNGRDDDCDGEVDEGDVCEVPLLNAQPSAYAPPTTTDVDGDGRADVCGRGFGGVWCHFARDGGWSEKTETRPAWSDPNGWTDPTNYATLRMGDLNGDGHADICARANAGITCHLGASDGFSGGGGTWLERLSNDQGGDHPNVYTTLRLADVNGDGRDDLCAREPDGFRCWLSDGERFGAPFEGPRWANDNGWGVARYYGTIRMGDVDGDGRADVCARAAAGIRCALAGAEGFGETFVGPEWSDASGWGAMQYWSTIRLADVNGDGRADLCGRDAEGLRCAFSSGAGFAEPVLVAPLSDASGWADLSNYGTLRVGDVDGDGAADLCLRANAGIRCYAWRDGTFEALEGPSWSDENGWSSPAHFHQIQLADVTGDGRVDLCARASAGWRCHPSMGDGFDTPMTLDEFTNAGGWNEPRYHTTLMVGGPRCLPREETCNGRDDDCDGEIDEGACMMSPPTQPEDAGTRADGGLLGDAGTDRPGVDHGMATGGCGCRAGDGGSRGALVAALGALATLRRRRAR